MQAKHPTEPHLPAPPLLRALERPVVVHALVLGLVLVYGLIRIPLMGSLGGDEAEQVLFAQTLQWGYEVTNPPLYTWIVYGAFALFGKSAALIISLKLMVLGLVYIALYHTALIALGKDRKFEAALTGLSPLLIFFVSWQAVFSYSHALLYALFAILTFMAFLKTVTDGSWRWFVMLGLMIGLGTMTKYSYLLFLFGLWAAGLTIPAARAGLLNPRMIVALGLGVLLLLPHAIWLLEHTTQLVARTEYKLQIEQDLPYIEGLIKGLWNILRALFAFLSPLWLIALVLFPKAFAVGSGRQQSLTSQWLGRTYLIVLAVMVGMVLVGGMTQFRPNYLFLFILAPLWLFARLPQGDRTGKRIALYGYAIALCGFLSLTVLFGKALYDPLRCKKCQNFIPYPQIAQALREGGFTKGTIFAHWYPHPLPGNLALYLDNARIVSQKFASLKPPLDDEPGQCLIVWVPFEQGGPETEPHMNYAMDVFGIPRGAPYEVTRLKLPLDHAPEKYVLVDYAFLNSDQGDCR